MHRLTLSAALLCTAPLALAQQAPAAPAAAKKPAAKTAPKPAAKAPAAKAPMKVVKAQPSSSRQQLKSAANQVAAGVRAADAALTPEQLAIAESVHTGTLPCELGAQVELTKDAASPGYFNLTGKGFRYRLHPVQTSTGAVRLEDPQDGAVWIQLANKSMLMDQKHGRRLADECASPAQVAVAEALKKNPPPSLLDPQPAAK
ncbi:MAG: hypothetical protein HZY78_10760 [Burkholderiaceae bacterium]|nr:MAG: hypothetical protein HZY78_10760 [Burkholderiaceae bacterium]